MSRPDLAGAADRQRARFELLMRTSLELALGDQCPDSEVRIIVLQPRLRTSESKDTRTYLKIARRSRSAINVG